MFNARFIVTCTLILIFGLMLPLTVLAQTSVPIGKQLEVTAGVGYLSPSFKNWNDGIALHNTTLTEKLYQASGSVGELGSNTMLQFQIKYYLNPMWSLALSIGQFETDASTDYSYLSVTDLGFWPGFMMDQQLAQTFTQDIRISPTMLTLAMNIPYSPNENLIDMYVGAGVGFMFSRIQNKVESTNLLTLHSATGNYAGQTIPLQNELLAHLSANVNPLAYQGMVGANLKYGILNLNLEVGYQFSRATIDEDDWTFFSQHDQTAWNEFTVKDDVDGAFMSYWWAVFQRKDFFKIPESQLDDLKIDKLELDGFIFKANLGIAF